MPSIDTVRVGVEVDPGEINLTGWKKTTEEFVEPFANKFIGEVYARNFRIGKKVLVKFRYIPTDYQRKIFNLLLAEFSIPKVQNGVNYEELDDWEAAYDTVNKIIARFPGLPLLPDIRDWVLYRIDLCHNHQVGSNVLSYIEALSNSHYPHRKRMPWKPNGVIFASKEISVCFYDKFAECKNENARGILRQETQIRSRRKLENKFGKKYPTLRDVTQNRVKNILEDDLAKLRLDKSIIGNRLKVEEILSNYYKPTRVNTLLGYLLRKNTLTYEQIIEKGLSRSTISRYERDIREAGISSLTIDKHQELPALSIGSEINIQNCNKVLSDTRTLNECELRKDAQIPYVVKGKEVSTDARMATGVTLTKERLISATKSHQRSMDRRLKKIVDAGIPLTITKHVEPLPPLVIDRNCIGDAESKS